MGGRGEPSTSTTLLTWRASVDVAVEETGRTALLGRFWPTAGADDNPVLFLFLREGGLQKPGMSTEGTVAPDGGSKKTEKTAERVGENGRGRGTGNVEANSVGEVRGEEE